MSEVDKTLHCSFCAKSATEVRKLIAGTGVYICDECVELCHSILDQSSTKQITNKESNFDHLPSPTKLKSYLDQHIVGQDYAKMVVSVAVHNHYKRLATPIDEDGVELDKSNVMVFGPSGSGKTYLAQTVAKYLDVPFAMSDATSLTEAGYVGEDVESIITKLLLAAGGDVNKCERGIIYLDEIDKKQKREGGNTRDVSGEGVQQALLKIIEGTELMVPSSGGKRTPASDMVKINTKNILFIVGGAFVGLEKVVAKSMNGDRTIGFTGTTVEEKPFNDILINTRAEHLVGFGIIPELIGRLPILAPLQELSTTQLVQVLTEPKNAIIKQFVKLFKLSEIDLEFTDAALLEIAQVATERKTGARGLRSVIEKKLMKTQFNLQDLKSQGAIKIIVDVDTIKNDSEPLVIFDSQKPNVA